jgi:hypothetical protein
MTKRNHSAAVATLGRQPPGTVRNATLMRFAPLMATMATVNLTNSSSLNCERASANTSSGTLPSVSRVRASVQASKWG